MRNSKVTPVLIMLMFSLVTGIQAQTVTPNKRYIVKELDNVNNLSPIKVSGSPDVEYRQNNGSKMTVSIYGSDNSVGLSEIPTVNGVLQVNIKRGVKILSGERRLRVIALSSSLNQVGIKDSTDVYLKGTIKGSDLNLSMADSEDIEVENLQHANIFALVKGNGDIDLKNVKATTVMSEVDGPGDINMKGPAQKATLTVNGSEDISAEKLAVTNVIATVVGPGDIVCYASRQLDARVSGSGDIGYKGSPLVVNKQGKRNSITGKQDMNLIFYRKRANVLFIIYLPAFTQAFTDLLLKYIQ